MGKPFDGLSARPSAVHSANQLVTGSPVAIARGPDGVEREFYQGDELKPGEDFIKWYDQTGNGNHWVLVGSGGEE